MIVTFYIHLRTRMHAQLIWCKPVAHTHGETTSLSLIHLFSRHTMTASSISV